MGVLSRSTMSSPRAEQSKGNSNRIFSSLENMANSTQSMDENRPPKDRESGQTGRPGASKSLDSEELNIIDGKIHSDQENFKGSCFRGNYQTLPVDSSKKQQIVSITRHRFEPFFTRDELLKELHTKRLSSQGQRESNRRQDQSPFSHRRQTWSASNSSPYNSASYRACQNCGYSSHESDPFYTEVLYPVISNEILGLCSHQSNGKMCSTNTGTKEGADAITKQENYEEEQLNSISSGNIKNGVDLLGEPLQASSIYFNESCKAKASSNFLLDHRYNETGPAARSTSATITRPSVMNTDTPRHPNAAENVVEFENVQLKGEDEINGVAENMENTSESIKVNIESWGKLRRRRCWIINEIPLQNSKMCQNGFLTPEEKTLKAFITRIDGETLTFMPPKEKRKCLKFTPGQYFYIVYENVPPDEYNRMMTIETRTDRPETEVQNINTKENLINDLKSIFSRLSSIDSRRLQERSVRETIKNAKAYIETYEQEMRKGEKNTIFSDRENMHSLPQAEENQELGHNVIASEQFVDDNRQSFQYPCFEKEANRNSVGVPSERGDESIVVNEKSTELALQKKSSKSTRKKHDDEKDSNRFEALSSVVCDETLACENQQCDKRKQGCARKRSESNLCKGQTCRKRRRQSLFYDMEESLDGEHAPAVKNGNDSITNYSSTDRLLDKSPSEEEETMEKLTRKKKKHDNCDYIKLKKEKANKGGKAKATNRSFCDSNEIEAEEQLDQVDKGADSELVQPREVSSQDKIVVADALLSLSESSPLQTDFATILTSYQDEIIEFLWGETIRFYRGRFDQFSQELEKSSHATNRESLQLFRKEKEREVSAETEKALRQRRQTTDLKMSCELGLMKQCFRQELWIRIQKCVCGRVGQLSCCSRCRSAFYCSKKCQVVDYDEHQLACAL